MSFSVNGELALGDLSLAVWSEQHTLTLSINSIQTWALEEARRRLEAEGILEDPHPEK